MTIETQSGMVAAPRRYLDGLKPWQRRLVYAVAFVIAWPIVMTLVYTAVPPPFSNLMILRLFTGNGIHKDWVSLNQMSPHLANAVITSEDARFCDHNGVDWVEFQGVVDDVFDDDEGPIRGASTISMQTAKNLFLWDGRSFVRKGLEIPIAYWMDLVLSKRRMIEIYLNIVEWAPGVYGAEAASSSISESLPPSSQNARPLFWPQFCQIPSNAGLESPQNGFPPSPTALCRG